jgi:hypothetical protein
MTRVRGAGQPRLVVDVVIEGVCPNARVADWVFYFKASALLRANFPVRVSALTLT